MIKLSELNLLGIMKTAAVGFSIAAYYLILGGSAGRMRPVPWLIGGAAGLILLMGARPIAESIDGNVQFQFIQTLLNML
ncbi:hypothetical protein [Cytobacillus purgationiresistens]|uniref:Uncharacterized protein n=1 Tax=Cytobacillus purgationiresistens TaxID=863449 RepID=A0ABU0AGF3_9BACI|nr:hypothetical protein [Cytobacillus purgationiresistens]MDQ0270341.1 hypothetical protein [Cytobacillus purgationiresistens]